MWPLIVALVSDKAGQHQGAVQGLAGSTGAIAAIIGLLLGGLLYAPLQGRLFVLSAVMIFVVLREGIRDGDFVFEPAPGEACGAVLGGWILGYRHLARCCGAWQPRGRRAWCSRRRDRGLGDARSHPPADNLSEAQSDADGRWGV
jgi:MFS family permease